MSTRTSTTLPHVYLSPLTGKVEAAGMSPDNASPKLGREKSASTLSLGLYQDVSRETRQGGHSSLPPLKTVS